MCGLPDKLVGNRDNAIIPTEDNKVRLCIHCTQYTIYISGTNNVATLAKSSHGLPRRATQFNFPRLVILVWVDF